MKKSAHKPNTRRKAHWFSSDRPIETARADVLDRSAFSTRLARSISGWDGRDSLVIALHGGWGTGKTSVKNMVLEKLRRRPGQCPQIVEFSPWQISGTGTLVGTFFQELGIALGVGHKRKAGLGKTLVSYAKHFGFLSHVVKPVGSLVSMVEPGTGALFAAGAVGLEQSAQTIQAGVDATKATQEARTKSLAHLKRDLAASLASLPRPVLIVIDDIDRLTTDEILQVFQLVKVNADFPNLVYLLLFERRIVEKALDRISGDRGHEFLQKIVQVEFHVPHAHRGAVERVLFTGLNKLIDADSINTLFDQDRWRDLYVGGVATYFQNLRHVYRFLGSFGFHVAQFKSGGSFEVNPVDLIGLEALRAFEPGLYEQISSAKRILTRDEGPVLFGHIKQDEVESAVGELLTHVPTNRHPQVRTILGVLFPPISRAFGNDEGVSGHKQQWLREHRVCHADLFDKFFALVVGEGDLSHAGLDRLISLAGDRKGFIAECKALQGRGLLKVAFERFDAYKDLIPLEKMPTLISSLCELSEEFPERQPGLFENDLNAYAWRLVYFGLRREPDVAKRVAILKAAFNQSSGLPLPVEIVGHDQRDPDEKEPHRDHLVDEAGLEELQGICVEKIRCASSSQHFLQHPRLLAFLFNWFHWGDKAEVRAWLAERVADEKGAVWLLRTLLLESSSTGVRGTRIHRHIDLRVVAQFSDVITVTRLTQATKPENLQGLDKAGLLEFRKALKRRADGRPDDDWKWESFHD